MNKKEISLYFNKYCRFKLRSGKEVFGVIWENSEGNSVTHYFASAVDHAKIQEKNKKPAEVTTPVNIDEIIIAELL